MPKRVRFANAAEETHFSQEYHGSTTKPPRRGGKAPTQFTHYEVDEVMERRRILNLVANYRGLPKMTSETYIYGVTSFDKLPIVDSASASPPSSEDESEEGSEEAPVMLVNTIAPLNSKTYEQKWSLECTSIRTKRQRVTHDYAALACG